MSRYLNPRADVVFKKIFGEHDHLLISFLNSLLPLPPDGLIESLTYLPTEQIPKIPILKRTIVDVRCTDQRGHIFIVEMQVEWSASFMQRMLFGASRAYVNQLKKGAKYKYLKPVYGLGLLGENFDSQSPDFYHHYKIVNVEKPTRELKGLQFVFIELKKFKPNNIAQKKLQVLWLRFMSEINENTTTIDPELLNIPEIREAIELSEQSAYNAAELDAYDAYWDVVSTEKTLLSDRYEKGKEENKADIAKKMLIKGMELSLIAELTGLTEAEICEIKKE
ncbi:MAG TPA: Rpn family recombination-promoting nuclease/putative transposase [Gammaproteobacteria bacterium]|nr:Rpn family recombination-promoting nuclease/putative transposase [Gammaproteobacteria bacterium]